MESKYSVFKEPWFTFVRVVEYVSWNLLLLLVWIFLSSLYLYFALKIGPTHKSPDWKTNSDQLQELWESTPCDIKSSAPVWFFVFVFSLSFLSPLFLVYLSVVVKKQQLVTPYGRKWQRLFEHLPVWTPPYAEEFGCLLSLINEKTEARVFFYLFSSFSPVFSVMGGTDTVKLKTQGFTICMPVRRRSSLSFTWSSTSGYFCLHGCWSFCTG